MHSRLKQTINIKIGRLLIVPLTSNITYTNTNNLFFQYFFTIFSVAVRGAYIMTVTQVDSV